MSQAGIINVGGGGVVTESLTGNDGVVVVPTGNNINVFGTGVVGSGISTAGNIYTTGSGSTLTINETKAQFLTNYTATNFAASPYTALAIDYYISVDTSGGAVTIRLPNAPTNFRIFVVKDRTGNALANNVTITTVGGVVTLDGGTSYLLNTNFEAATIIFNGTSYEVF